MAARARRNTGISVKAIIDPKSFRRIENLLDTLQPPEIDRLWDKILTASAGIVQDDAANRQIIRGRGKADPVEKRLTYRSGQLASSIAPDFRKLPRAVLVGTFLEYGRIHEKGIGRYPRRPFLQPALESRTTANKINRAMRIILAREIAKGTAA